MPKSIAEYASKAYLGYWTNPSSPHSQSEQSKKLIKTIRTGLARLPLSGSFEATICGSATEANNIALNSALSQLGSGVLVSSPVEHASLNARLGSLDSCSYFNLLPSGQIDLNELRERKEFGKLRVAVCQAANNETGVVYAIDELRKTLPAECRIVLDLSQGLGKLTNWREMIALADYITLSPHKFYGPKGVGILLSRTDAPLVPLLMGGGQENGIRPGTENVPLLAMLLEWLKIFPYLQEANSAVSSIRNDFESVILTMFPNALVIGSGSERLGNTSAIHVPGVDADALVAALDAQGWAVSLGSACHSGALEPSHVYRAHGLTWDQARETVRFSFGLANPPETGRALAQIVTHAIKRIQSIQTADELCNAGTNNQSTDISV